MKRNSHLYINKATIKLITLSSLFACFFMFTAPANANTNEITAVYSTYKPIKLAYYHPRARNAAKGTVVRRHHHRRPVVTPHPAVAHKKYYRR